MAEYAVVFTADASSAESSIKNLKKSIKGVTKEFENAEIGAGDFLAAASDLSQLQKELKDASSAVVDIDKAYGDLDKALAAMQKAYEKANKEAVSYHKDTLKIAEDSAKQEDRLLKQRMDAERKAFEERLKMAVAEDRRNKRRFSARMEFRAGMGARGAIPEVASPVRGSANIPGSPAHIEANTKALDEALATMQKAYENASKEAASYHKDTVKLAADSAKEEDRLLKQAMEAERKAFDERLKMAAAETRAKEKRFKARTEFTAGMGARGAIPAVASPIRGGINYGPTKGGNGIPASEGSPAYLELTAKAAKDAESALKGVATATKNIKPAAKSFAPGSLAYYESKLKVLQKEARLIAPDGNRWKELNKQILQAEKGIRKINQKQSLGASARDRVGAAGGAFLYGGGMGGGVGSAVGGIAGGLMGGVPGAFAGAAVGQVADNLGTALAGITSQAAAVQKIQRGLAMASVDAKDFAQAQAAVGEMSQKLLVPLEQTAKYFTQLRANTKEYNLSVDETRQILEGTVLAIMATGGSAEDLDGAMRAVVQIMSKGGVQAEELRGQLGERFPGAVVKFAQANKLSFEQLQDGLEQGTIGIQEFINFAKKNYADYAKFSEQLATAPEYAGQRLQIALEQVSLAIGSLFTQSGAELQDLLTGILGDIKKFVVDNEQELKTIASGLTSLVKLALEAANILKGVFGGIYDGFKGIADIAITLRNMTGKGDIQSVATERQDINRQINESFKNVASSGSGFNSDDILGTMGAASMGPLMGPIVEDTVSRLNLEQNAEKTRLESLKRRRAELDKLFADMGGNAAYQASKPGSVALSFGGAGAGMSLSREEKNKRDSEFLDAIEKREQAIADAREKREEDIGNVRKQAVEKVKQIDEDFAKQRLSKEREIAKAKRELAQSGQESASKLRQAEIGLAGGDTDLVRIQQLVLKAANQQAEEKIALEEKLLDEQSERAKKIEDLKRETANAINEANARYTKAIGETQQSYARSVAKIIDKGTESASKRLIVAAQIAALYSGRAALNKEITSRAGFGIPEPQGGQYQLLEKENASPADIFLSPDFQSSYYQLAELFTIDKKIAKLSTSLSTSMGTVATSVKPVTVNISDLTDRVNQSAQGLQQLDEAFRKVSLDKSSQDFATVTVDEVIQQYQNLTALRNGMKDELKERSGVLGLRRKGFGAEQAQENYQILAESDKALQNVNALFDEAISKTTDKTKIPELLADLDKATEQIIAARNSTLQLSEAVNNIPPSIQLGTAMQDVKDKLNDLKDPAKQVIAISESIATSFGESFKQIITGASTVQQGLVNLFQSIGDSFAQMAQEMITQWLRVQLMEGIGNLFNLLSPLAGAAGGISNIGPVAQSAGIVPKAGFMGPAFANGGIALGGFQKFATGGIVKGPTMGLVGEGRYNEAVVPLPDGKSIPVDLSGMGGGAGAISTNIVINVNNGQAQSNTSGGASDLGRKMEGAVKQVLANELRPGGLLSGGRR